MFPRLEEGGLATYRAALVQNQHLTVLAEVSGRALRLRILYSLCSRFQRSRYHSVFSVGENNPCNCPFSWGIRPPPNMWFPGPTRVHNPNGSVYPFLYGSQLGPADR